MTRSERLKANLDDVEARIAAACLAAGRPRSAVRLVAVTKYVDAATVQQLAELGVTDCGESRPQLLWEKAAALPALRWHLVGHLQRNKIERTLPAAALIHSVDSLRLLEALQAEAVKQNQIVPVLLEIHLSGEAAKQGFAPAELEPLGEQAVKWDQLEIRGLMTMAALHSAPAEARQTFSQLRELRDRLRPSWPHGERLRELSMGMTNDFPEAIAEGATLLRVGSALFDGLLQERA